MIRQRIMIFAGIAAIVLLVCGISRLFMLRFRAGDIYPPYSTLRADPLGAKAFYDSLDECVGLSVSRNYVPIADMELDPRTTFLILGDNVAFDPNSDTIPSDTAAKLTQFMRKGGRLVITLLPRNRQLRDYFEEGYEESDPKSAVNNETDKQKEDTSGDKETENDNSNKQNKSKKADKLKKKLLDEALASLQHDLATTNWTQSGFVIASNREVSTAAIDESMVGSGLPAMLSCHTRVAFANMAPDWKTLYRADGNPVVIERRVGEGSLVLSALTYFVSNEGMRKERHPALLAWLVGDHKKIVFDETHHLIFETPGMMFLYRKYHLQWLGLGFLILAGLFVWQNTMNLVPTYSRPAVNGGREVAKGKDSTSGLVNILKRNITGSSVLGVCISEWKKTADTTAPGMLARIRRMDALAGAGTQESRRSVDVARTYNEICHILKEQQKENNDKKETTWIPTNSK